MSTPSFNFTISYPGNLLEQSFLDLTVTNSSIFPAGTVLDAWCLDKSIDVSPGQTYTGYVYSAYEPPSISSIVPNISGYVDHLDSVNWLLNYYTGTNPQYNWGEVQSAIWTLMGQDYQTELGYIQSGGSVLAADVNSLVSQALAHDGYRPGLGESIAMIVNPVDASGQHGQPLLVEVKAAALGDRVWNDADADGLQDSGELGIVGAKVELVRDVNGNGAIEANEVLSTTTTDANGNYRFTGLMPGLQYQVRFTQPTGFDGISPRKVDGSSTSGTNSDGLLSDVVVLKAGEYNQTIDAGFYKKTVAPPTTASLGDRVWLDTNGNGQQDAGEVGVGNVMVKLINAAGTVLAAQTTDANGHYLFTNLQAGQYGVEFTKPNGYSFTTANTGADATDSDVNAITGHTGLYTLTAGETNLTVDAGLVVATTPPPANNASLGDRVWLDANGNGQQDSGEVGVANVTVQLLNAAGTVLATQTTNANGNYLFSNLAAGQYSVAFVKPTGYNFTAADIGADGTDSDANTTTGRTGTYTLAAGQQNLTVDAGLVCPPPTIPTKPDSVQVCEDRSVSFNVLSNDMAGLKLVGVAHENATLDATFKNKAGAISFTADGQVTYKTMTNYYGNDKLVYTVEDAAGNRSTQTVDVGIKAVSDMPVSTIMGEYYRYHWDNNGGNRPDQVINGVNTWVHSYSLSEFGTFNDANDQLQQFGTYNVGVANDVDTLKAIRVYGISVNGDSAWLAYNGIKLDFSAGQAYDVSVADINAGKLQIFGTKTFTDYPLNFAYVDTGTVANDACYNGTVVSLRSSVAIWTPVALDLNGDGHIGVTGATSSYQKDANAKLGHTVQFDMNGDGHKETMEWFNGSGDGILIDNRDGNAAHDMSGLRLFGDHAGAFGNGYYKLETFDTNGDGKLSGKELSGIELWIDNGDAVVQDGEIQTLAQHGIDAIGTELSMTFDAEGKLHIQSTATRTDGSSLLSEDVFFAGVGSTTPTLADVLGDDAALDHVLGAAAPATTDVLAQCFSPDITAMAEVLRKMVAAQASAEMATA